MRSLCCFCWCCGAEEKDFRRLEDQDDDWKRRTMRRLEDALANSARLEGDDWVFSLLLSLFLQLSGRNDDDSRVHSLDRVTRELREAYVLEPDALEFYLPQLVTFLVIGGREAESARQFWLELCEQDLRIAHRTDWFLFAFFSGPRGAGGPGVSSTAKTLRHEAQERGFLAASRLSRRLRLKRPPKSRRAVGTNRGWEDGDEGIVEQEQQRTQEQQMQPLSPPAAEDTHDTNASSRAASAAATAADASAYPATADDHEGTSEVAEADRQDVSEALPPPPPPPPPVLGSPPPQPGGSPEHYHPAMFFLEGLAQLSLDLGMVEPARRSDAAKEGLAKLNEFFLSDKAVGSEVIYVPFGNAFLQVRGIHPEESVVFATKERVPLLVCLEVLAASLPDLIPRRGEAARARQPGLGDFVRSKAAGGGEMLDRIKRDISENLPKVRRLWSRQQEQQQQEEQQRTSLSDAGGDRREIAAATGSSGGGGGGGGLSTRARGRSRGSRGGSSDADELAPQPLVDSADAYSPNANVNRSGMAINRLASIGGHGLSVGGGGGGAGDMTSRSILGDEGELRRAVSYEAMGQWAPPSAEEPSEDVEPTRYLALLRQASESTSRAFHSAVRFGSAGADGGGGGGGGGGHDDDHGGIGEGHDEEKRSVRDASSDISATDNITDSKQRPLLRPARAPDSGGGGGGGGGATVRHLSDPPDPRLLTASNLALAEVSAASSAEADADARMLQGNGNVEPAEGPKHSDVIFRERWADKEARIREVAAAAGRVPENAGHSWRLVPIIVKANDDLRQEQFVSQLIRQCDRIFREADLDVYLRPYEILALGPRTGVIEAIPDTVSLHALRRHWASRDVELPEQRASAAAADGSDSDGILPEFFKRHFGSSGLRHARECFVESCAAYSIVCYLFQIKDRHNGNLLLDSEGHLIHIDWGFVLGQSPGGNWGFEKAPFKLTAEMVAVMGGPRSFAFQRFRNLAVRAFLEARRNREKIIMLVEAAAEGSPDLACFLQQPQVCVAELRRRFHPGKSVRECIDLVNGMIDDALDNWRTRWYDKFQRYMVGIL